MKLIQINSVKKYGYLVLSIVLLSFFSCLGQEKKSKTDNSNSSTSKTEVKAPSVDIHTASFFGNLDAIIQHIKAGTDLNQKDQYGSTPLGIASTFGKTEVALALINGDADLHIRNNEGSTALHIASFFCRTEIVKVLLEKGVDKSIKNNYGSTALESVSSSFNDVKPIYSQISKDLGPLGLKLDYNHLKTTRPLIAEMLK